VCAIAGIKQVHMSRLGIFKIDSGADPICHNSKRVVENTMDGFLADC
jgi:hypothetical protein